MAKTFLRLRDVVEATGLGSSTIYEMIASENVEGANVQHPFPKPIKVGRRAVAWLDEEIEQWQLAKIADREKESNRLGRAGGAPR